MRVSTLLRSGALVLRLDGRGTVLADRIGRGEGAGTPLTRWRALAIVREAETGEPRSA